MNFIQAIQAMTNIHMWDWLNY